MLRQEKRILSLYSFEVKARNIILIVFLSTCSIGAQSYTLGTSVHLGSGDGFNYGINLHGSYWLDTEHSVEINFGKGGADIEGGVFKHTLDITSFEASYLWNRKRNHSNSYFGVGAGIYFMSADYLGNYIPGTYEALDISPSPGISLKAGFSIYVFELGAKYNLIVSHINGKIENPKNTGKLEPVSKFTAFNFFQIYLGLVIDF